MPSLIDIRRRIKSVKNTQQITKAMKMVAAARVRKTQEAILNARPYADKMLEVMNSLAARVDRSSHPLLELHDNDEHVEILVITADRGLCGSFNTNAIKTTLNFMDERRQHDIGLNLVGKKGRDFFRRQQFHIIDEYIELFPHVAYEQARTIGQDIIAGYQAAKLDKVYVIYNKFVSMLSQQPVVEQLLPIKEIHFEEENRFDANGIPLDADYIYEPTSSEILKELLPRHVNVQIYRALLESAAAENAARMNAMDNATRNAADMIKGLTLEMNRIRQEAITTEILEVVSGADALKNS
jgi:F-type H+-transporting ATPase subunit gamma